LNSTQIEVLKNLRAFPDFDVSESRAECVPVLRVQCSGCSTVLEVSVQSSWLMEKKVFKINEKKHCVHQEIENPCNPEESYINLISIQMFLAKVQNSEPYL
jgi:hypothetical protein